GNLQDGVTDPLDYPSDLDDIASKTLAVKVKWQPNWKSGSAIAIIESDNFISEIQSQFPPDEVCLI
ncbi:replication protein A1-like protein, partial [Trifolium medium]|nr:replication protein A1-like protein [Trifolium medium]